MECLNLGARSVYSVYIDPYVHLTLHDVYKRDFTT